MDNNYSELTTIMLKMGFRCNHKGFIYLRTLLMIALSGKEVLPLSDRGYTYIGREYGVSVASVEKNIANAISYAWTTGNVILHYQLFKYSISDEKGKPTNKQFLLTMLKYIDEKN